MNRCSGGGEKQTKSATEPSLVNCSPDGGVTTKFVVDCGKARNQSVGNWMSKKQRWGRWSRGEVIKSWAGPLQENVWLGDAAETCEIVVFSSVSPLHEGAVQNAQNLCRHIKTLSCVHTNYPSNFQWQQTVRQSREQRLLQWWPVTNHTQLCVSTKLRVFCFVFQYFCL